MPRKTSEPHIETWVAKAEVGDEFVYPDAQVTEAYSLYERGQVMLFQRRLKVRVGGQYPFERVATRVTPEILEIFDAVSRFIPAPKRPALAA